MRTQNRCITTLAWLTAAAAVLAGRGYEQETPIYRTEENPECTSSNVGATCQTRVCSRIQCFTGESECTPTDWNCSEWQQGRCRRLLFFYWCDKE